MAETGPDVIWFRMHAKDQAFRRDPGWRDTVGRRCALRAATGTSNIPIKHTW